jgi:hypothetical protein
LSKVTVTVVESPVSVDVTEEIVKVVLSDSGPQGPGGTSYTLGDPIYALVRNATGSTLTKGTIVYTSGATGDHVKATPALANSQTTSARSFGFISEDIANGADGYVMVEGYLTGLNTAGLTAGQQLYLSGTTPGAWTTSKPYAPIHLVYVGVVARVNATSGSVYVKVQNGYEFDELHDVDINHTQAIATGDLLQYQANGLWQNVPTIAPNKVAGTAVITTDARLSDQRTPLDGSVTSAKIVDGAIVTNDIADGAITSAKIANGSILNVDIADGAITSAKISAAGLSPASVAGTAVITTDSRLSDQRTPLDSSVTSAKIVDGAIVTNDLADGAVTSAKIANGAILTADIADGAVTTAKLDSIVTAGTSPKITFNAQGRVTAGDTLSASDIPTLPQSQLAGVPIAPWAASTPYTQGDLVSYQNVAYRRISTGTSGAAFDPLMWQQQTPSGLAALTASQTFTGFQTIVADATTNKAILVKASSTTTSALFDVQRSADTTSRLQITNTGDLYVAGATRIADSKMTVGNGYGVLAIGNGTAPTSPPTANGGAGGGLLYAQNSELKWYGPTGSPITIAASNGDDFQRTMPQRSTAVSTILALTDAGRHIYVTASSQTITIPANSGANSVAFPIGTVVTIVNDSASTITIGITTDTLVQANSTNMGSRTLAAYGMATLLKVTATRWFISGNGVS